MKEGWRYEKLDDLGTIVTGATPSTNDESNYFPKEYCFVKPSDLPLNVIGSIHETENYVSSKGLSVSRPLPAGSVLTTCIGTIGKVGLLLQEGCTNQQINAVIPNNKINSRYLAYALLSIRKQLEFVANAPVVPIINKKSFSKIHIGYPPKPTQLSIVSELDKLNELIRIKKEQLKDYDTLAQSIFYEMFGDPVENEKGWEVKELIETVIPECKISYGIVQPGEHVEDGVPIVRPVDMLQTFISKDGLKKTTKEISNSYNRTILTGKELLICVRGTTGVVSLVDESLKGANVTRGIAPLLFSMDVERWFMYYQIKTPSVRGVISSLTRGIALKQINMSDLRKIQVILPPLPLQHSFAQKIEQIEQQKAAIQKTITDLETLLAARMQYWFD